MDNLKAALRSLLSTPGPAVVVIATLAIAIGANTAIFSVVNGVLLRPLGYGDDSRIVVPWATNAPTSGVAGGAAGGVPYEGASSHADLELFRLSPADYRDLREDASAFGGQVALSRYIGSTLTAVEPPVRVGSLTVTPRLFSVLRAKPAIGGFFTDEDERPGGEAKIVITHASWTRRFGGDPSILGSTIELDGSPRTVIGVAEEGFQFPPGSDEVEMYFPMALSDGILLDRDHRMFDALARLADGATLEAARAEVAAIAERLAEEFPDSNEGWGMTLRPLREELLGDLATTLWVLSGAVFLVLLVACANIANLLVARSTATSREFAVRVALGARPGDLIKRSLAESLILGVLGGLGGAAISVWGVALLRTLTPADIPRADSVTLDGTVLMFGAALSIGAAVLFGSLPALRSMAPDLVELIKPSGSFGSATQGGRRLRELMVVIEVALAIVLLVGAGLMVRSFARLSEVDPGFRQDGVISVAVKLPQMGHGRDEWRIFWEQLLRRVEELPGVTGAGAVSDLPMSSVGLDLQLDFTVSGLDAVSPTARPNANFRLVMPGYFETMGMEIVSGRALDDLDATSDRVVAVVNETVVDTSPTSIRSAVPCNSRCSVRSRSSASSRTSATGAFSQSMNPRFSSPTAG